MITLPPPPILVAVLLAAATCGAEPTTQPEPAPVEEPQTADTCGPRGERFANLDWIPADTRFAALAAYDAEGFDQAGLLLEELSRSQEHPLPIVAQAELGQLDFELSSMQTTMQFAGFFPAELVKVHSSSGVPVYVWPSTCDLDLARDKVTQAYGVVTRKTVDGMVGVHDQSDFPFDILFLRGDRVAFTPRGRSTEVMEWLSAPAEPTLSGEPRPKPGPKLRELDDAPFRILIQGDSLVSGDGETQGGVRLIRATSVGVELDGSLVALSPPAPPNEASAPNE